MEMSSIAVAEGCLAGAHDGTMSFPQVVGALAGAGFESYAVDFRRNTTIWYRPDGESLLRDTPLTPGDVAAAFDAAGVAAAVRAAQAGGPDYSYQGFCDSVRACGCAGYLVSFPGRRVVYHGRTAETHVEHFPS
ncbi:DUF1398 domain-containing protein [Methylobrevis pamukkalensis]|uniref:DUF1398 domain-containing protein n=1 Tax=Methylobrevis pamukkalensis TaxID=1439726 RepID=A0A1E3H6V3_9HYPH|nr:DUF1398 domain-containing protein [Methylobrevis pamukkalensis]ODN72052.1 hypothetical protein A6302_00567 [Methylobrevis pamukkalensis]